MNKDSYEEKRDHFIDRMLRSARGTFVIFTIYIGHRLGYYSFLAAHGWTTAKELANGTDPHERYAREWLEQQTSVGIVEVQDAIENDINHCAYIHSVMQINIT
jgi:hypothetical protein